MKHTIQINEKKQIKISEGNMWIVCIEYVFKGKTKWHALIDTKEFGTFEQIVAELEELQSMPEFTKKHDIMVFQGPA